MPNQTYGYQTADGFSAPSVRQLSVFLDDRVGALMGLFQAFEGTNIRVVGMSVVHAIDCAIVRLICDDTDEAIAVLERKNFAVSQTELVVVEVPPGHGLRSIFSALIAGEVNLDYAYPLLIRPHGRAVLAVHSEDLETAVQLLRGRKYNVLNENDMGPDGIR